MPALDGLRGLAVAAVVAFHLGHLDGGYLGVDLFFVLSGYLITGLLLDERRRDRRDQLADFWRRRARRIVPAQLVLVLGAVAFGALVMDDAGLAALRGDGVAAVLGVANWHDLRTADGYWDLFAAPSPLAHLWSLSIELQLYLVWPLVVRSVVRRRGVGGVGPTALGLAVASAGWAITRYAGGASADRVYLGTDTRAAALLLGAALAGLEASRRARGAPAQVPVPLPSALVAVGVVAAQWWSLDGLDPTLYRGGLLLHGAAATVLVAVAVGPRTRWLHPVLELRPLVALGVVSYGVYLWHWLVIVWADEARTGLDGAPLLAVRLALTLVASLASWVLVEKPLRRGGVPDRLLPAAAPAAALVVLLLLGVVTAGASEAPRSLADRPDPVDDPRPRALVVGDSLGLNLATAMFELDAAHDVRVVGETYPGCTLAPEGTPQRSREGVVPAPGCGPHPDAATAMALGLERTSARQVVVVFALPDLADQQHDGAWVRPCLDDDGALALERLRALVPEDPEIGVTLLTTPMPGAGATGVLAGSGLGLGPQDVQRRIDCHNQLLDRLGRELAPRVRVLDLAARVCTGTPCPPGDDERRPDGLHLAGGGLTDVAAWLLDELDDRVGG